MRALVTGGGGFLGLAIVRQLLARGTAVRTFSRSPHPALNDLRVDQCLGDLSDSEAAAQAVSGCDIVFHVAAKTGMWGTFEDFHRINVIGTQHIIQACRRHRVHRLVYTSSPSVVFDGNDMEGVNESVPYPAHFDAHYPHTKALAEQAVRAASDAQLATVSLRPHLIWGPGDTNLLPRLVARARARQLRRIGSADKRVDTIYIDNAAEAHLLAADRLNPASPVAGRVYFISQDEPVFLWDMVNRMLAAAGAPKVDRTISPRLALALAWAFELAHAALRRPGEPRLTRFVVKEMCTAHWFDITAARRDLDYRPSISITEGLRRLAAARLETT